MIGSLAGLRQVSIELWIELEVGIPKRDVSESAESRKSVVGIALSWAASIGTSAKDFFRVSNQVPRDGKDCAVAAMEVELRYSTLVVYESRVAAFWRWWNQKSWQTDQIKRFPPNHSEICTNLRRN